MEGIAFKLDGNGSWYMNNKSINVYFKSNNNNTFPVFSVLISYMHCKWVSDIHKSLYNDILPSKRQVLVALCVALNSTVEEYLICKTKETENEEETPYGF